MSLGSPFFWKRLLAAPQPRLGTNNRGFFRCPVGFVIPSLRPRGLDSEHYKHHWFPEKPCKGSGYRCIRINHKMDPLIGQAAQRIGLSSQELFQLLPSELTLWVDPYEVSYRIGEDGSICVLYEAAPAGGSQSNTNMQMVDSRISCKEELLLGRTSPSKSYNMMTVSG
uniref:Protein BTG1 n=1 Tax=Ficedula albicollis TaxID=59894 RepID=U3K7Y2_FICAL